MEIPEPLAPVLQRIAATSPELGDDPVMAASLYENVTSMLADAHRHYADGLEASITGDQLLADEHLATGALHAERMQHPAGAMLAAEVLFDEYLPVFVDEVGARPRPSCSAPPGRSTRASGGASRRGRRLHRGAAPTRHDREPGLPRAHRP